jgi:hypothetical protein
MDSVSLSDLMACKGQICKIKSACIQLQICRQLYSCITEKSCHGLPRHCLSKMSTFYKQKGKAEKWSYFGQYEGIAMPYASLEILTKDCKHGLDT